MNKQFKKKVKYYAKQYIRRYQLLRLTKEYKVHILRVQNKL